MRGQSLAQREQSLAHMEALLQATGFPFHLAHLEQVQGCWEGHTRAGGHIWLSQTPP